MFLLDWNAYNYGREKIGEPLGTRKNTMIVDENNAEEWMNLLAGELTAEQIPYTIYEDGGQAPLMFVIDFDQKLWVGCQWHMDQSALHEYQPADWIADEDDVFKYAPKEVAQLWDRQLVTQDVLLYVEGNPHILIAAGKRPIWWGEVRVSIDTTRIPTPRVEVKQASEVLKIHSLSNLPLNEQFDLCFRYFLGYNKHLSVEVRRCPPEAGYWSEQFADLGSLPLS
jgi:hypothetical protein